MLIYQQDRLNITILQWLLKDRRPPFCYWSERLSFRFNIKALLICFDWPRSCYFLRNKFKIVNFRTTPCGFHHFYIDYIQLIQFKFWPRNIEFNLYVWPQIAKDILWYRRKAGYQVVELYFWVFLQKFNSPLENLATFGIHIF